jgi:glyceraldehyde-3-phosphate dehydrogenase/erythrose-4-phosphate dehydrogenase
VIDGTQLAYSCNAEPGGVPRGDSGVDVVLECTGAFRLREHRLARIAVAGLPAASGR